MPKGARAAAMNLMHICPKCSQTFPENRVKVDIPKYLLLGTDTTDRLYSTSDKGSNTDHSSCNASQIQDVEKQRTRDCDPFTRHLHTRYNYE